MKRIKWSDLDKKTEGELFYIAVRVNTPRADPRVGKYAIFSDDNEFIGSTTPDEKRVYTCYGTEPLHNVHDVKYKKCKYSTLSEREKGEIAQVVYEKETAHDDWSEVMFDYVDKMESKDPWVLYPVGSGHVHISASYYDDDADADDYVTVGCCEIYHDYIRSEEILPFTYCKTRRDNLFDVYKKYGFYRMDDLDYVWEDAMACKEAGAKEITFYANGCSLECYPTITAENGWPLFDSKYSSVLHGFGVPIAPDEIPILTMNPEDLCTNGNVDEDKEDLLDKLNDELF